MKENKEILQKFFNRELNEVEMEEFINRASTDKDFIKSFVKELEARSAGENELPENEETAS